MTDPSPGGSMAPATGALPLTRMLFPSCSAVPGTLVFPVSPPVPRAWEAVVPALLCFGVVGAGLEALVPGLGPVLALAIAPLPILAAVLACGILARTSAGRVPARWSIAVMLAACAGVAYSHPGWPRDMAIVAAGFVFLNVLAAAMDHLNAIHRVTITLLGLHSLAVPAYWLGGWQWAAIGLSAIGLVMVISTFLPRGGLFVGVLRRFDSTDREVCLTIDDGPCGDTGAVLDVLAEFGCKAMFFVIGDRVCQQPDALRRMAGDGHGIGNHTRTHPAFRFWGFSPARMRRELADCQDQIIAACGVRTIFFRPPVGFRNPYCPVVAGEMGMTIMGWQARGWDGVDRDPAKVVARIRRSLRPGAIILLHQGMPRSLETLRSVLEMLRDEGWLVTLPQEWVGDGTHRASC